MKRVGSNYHVLHVLKTDEPKLRKTLIINCNKELVNCISECVLNVLNGNLKLSSSNTRKLQKNKSAHRKVADRNVSLSGKKRLIVEPLLCAILRTIASLIFKPDKNVT